MEDPNLKIKLHDFPGHLIRRCHQISVGMFHDVIPSSKLTSIQYAILWVLKEVGETDQITLAGYVAINRTSMGDVADRLEKRGLISRKVNANDRRMKLLVITPKGEELLADVSETVELLQERLLAPLNEDEKKQFIKLLKRIAEENNEWSRAPLRSS